MSGYYAPPRLSRTERALIAAINGTAWVALRVVLTGAWIVDHKPKKATR